MWLHTSVVSKLHYCFPHLWFCVVISSLEYRSDDITQKKKKNQRFGYHVSVEHDEKHPQPKFDGNQFIGVQDMAAWISN